MSSGFVRSAVHLGYEGLSVILSLVEDLIKILDLCQFGNHRMTVQCSDGNAGFK